MQQKIIKAGNSLAVTIPSSFVKAVGLKVGAEAHLEVKSDTGQLIFTFPGNHQLTISSLSISQKER